MARTSDGDVPSSPKQHKKLPFFCLAGSVADAAMANSCLACFDHTDVVIRFMATPLDENGVMSEAAQSLTTRNERKNPG